MMQFNRKFEHAVDGKIVVFDVTYNPTTHYFQVLESGKAEGYLLKFDMQHRQWSTEGEVTPAISADELALLVQQQFGHFV
ncbi:hypothetical protein [Sphingobacterium bambusae]|uniref:Uncharacterized protein n=1 Tax=Sphingobacterium bambusae TaxID=662858 RepID=A0ABW6BBN9_9SPHI|nr:hypothetical protein [Sphingobacterium bambusae]WPL48904.1 hypothetical protein SCB77_00295 [Sphingobacterium bambusae]